MVDSWLAWGANKEHVSGEGYGLEGSALVSDNKWLSVDKKNPEICHMYETDSNLINMSPEELTAFIRSLGQVTELK